MLSNDSTRCKSFCTSCLILHHCHGEHAVCPYGRESEEDSFWTSSEHIPEPKNEEKNVRKE